ncbi:MAG TPA: exo-beta-N-acetylmuramidase NamZ domain-containing protein [Thermoanaerobaculia bacterium]
MRRLLIVFLFAITAHAQPFDSAKLREIDATINRAVTDRKLPGGVLWVERNGTVVRRIYGNRAVEPQTEPTTVDTIYDAASLTKVVATAPSIWRLIERGKLQLDAPAKTYVPELADGSITIRHLLTHSSGLRPSLDLREPWTGYDEGVRRALAETPRNRPGAVFRYSDINYILLGEVVRRVSGEPLDVFAKREIFEPLAMRDTGFRPAETKRVAPTEREVARGAVHDPTARRMGGVAGHAGLFTTAEDLAKFARAILGGRFPRAMTNVQSPPEVAIKRAGGFDVDSHYARPRGTHFPVGSFGHTGWTGPFLWIDPQSQTFYVFLSNRVHPDGKGSVVALQRQLGTLVAEAAGLQEVVRPRVQHVIGGGDVLNGIDVLHGMEYAPLRGLRVGLVTNHTGIDRHGNPTIDLLRSAPGVHLVALFSPEHGIRGTLDKKLGDEVDAVTKLPIYSLYGERRKPSREQLANLDALVFDIQDIGTRFYTYISTMGLAMEAAAEAKVKFFVLDRVNPIGDVVAGPLLEGKPDFVAWHTLPIQHGMTVGELAKMFNAEREIGADLTVIPLRGWTRAMWQDDAGLPWINTSPNMRSLHAAALYPGIGILERAISVGRGTDTPFEILGAPYIDGTQLVREVGALPGLTLTPARFTPTASIHKGEECGGVRITITDRKALRAVDAGLTIAAALARLYPAKFPVDELQPLLRHKATLEAIREGKVRIAPTAEFEGRRAKYLLYGITTAVHDVTERRVGDGGFRGALRTAVLRPTPGE